MGTALVMHGDHHVIPKQTLAPVAEVKAHRQRWFEYHKPIPLYWTLVLGVAVWVIFFGVWELAAAKGWVNTLFMPPPHQVLSTLYTMIVEKGFLYDIGTSIYRILASFALACAVAIPLGVLMGSFRSIDAFFNPFVSAWRYLPAPAFIPLLLMWFGAGEGSKLALLFIGVIFFLITLIMDHTRAVRAELIETAMTLGANRWQILSTIVLPAVAPKIMKYARWGADDLRAKGRRPSLWALVTRPAWRFVRDYFIYSGWRDGMQGFIAAVLSSFAAFLKYAFLFDQGGSKSV